MDSVLSEQALLLERYSRPFNSIEWILILYQYYDSMRGELLSIPLNGFQYRIPMSEVERLKTLSIPLNGFPSTLAGYTKTCSYS